MLNLVNAGIGHGKRLVLDGATFQLAPGEVCGLVAPNGFGKTTLMFALSGDRDLLRKGSITLDGSVPTASALRAKVFYAPGDASILQDDMSPRFHINAVARLWGSPLNVDEVIEHCGITEYEKRPAHALSQGMRQQTVLAMALMSGAPYILLDETLNALDPIKVNLAMNILEDLRSRGTGILILSHILESIDRACSRVVFFRDRKLVSIDRVGDSERLFKELYG